MKNLSELSINLLEQKLLRMYYLAPVWEKFLKNDKKPDIFKTEEELMRKEFGKRLIAVAKKVGDCAKSNVLNKYIKCYPPIFDNNSIDFEFDLSLYFTDAKLGVPLYNAELKTEVTVTTIKKLFKKIEKKTETKYVEITLSEDIIKLNEILCKYVEVLEDSGIVENNYLGIDFDVSIGVDNNRNKNEIAELKNINLTNKRFKLDTEEDSTTGEMTLVTNYDEFIIEAESDGRCKFSTKGYGPAKLYLTRTIFENYIPSREIISQLLEKYFSINPITADEIEETLETHETKADFDEWLEERLKTVVVSGERLITEAYK